MTRGLVGECIDVVPQRDRHHARARTSNPDDPRERGLLPDAVVHSHFRVAEMRVVEGEIAAEHSA